MELKLPRTFVDLHRVDGYVLNGKFGCRQVHYTPAYHLSYCTYPTKEEALAAMVLPRLLQLRNRYNDAEKITSPECWVITKNADGTGISLLRKTKHSCVLKFKSEDLRNTFYSNFKHEIKTALPFL